MNKVLQKFMIGSLVLAFLSICGTTRADTAAGGSLGDQKFITCRAGVEHVSVVYLDHSIALVFVGVGSPVFYSQRTFTEDGLTWVQSSFDIWGIGRIGVGPPSLWYAHFAFNDDGPIGDEAGAAFRFTPGGTKFYSFKKSFTRGYVVITP